MNGSELMMKNFTENVEEQKMRLQIKNEKMNNEIRCEMSVQSLRFKVQVAFIR